MSRKSSPVVCLVVFLMIAISPSTALASFEITKTECSGSGIPTLCIESAGKLFEAKGAEGYSGKLVAGTKILFTVPSIPVEVTCGKDTSVGTVKQPNPGIEAVIAYGTLDLEECQLTGTNEISEDCVIRPSEDSKELVGTTIDEMPVSAGIVKPVAGSAIIEITFSNKTGRTCPTLVSGKKTVTGEDLCITSEAEVDKTVHSGECKNEGSKLKFLGKMADFECKAEVELSGTNHEAKWDVSLA